MRSVDDVRSNNKIIIKEFGTERVVCDDATDFTSSEKYDLRARSSPQPDHVDPRPSGSASIARHFPVRADASTQSLPYLYGRLQRQSCLPAQTELLTLLIPPVWLYPIARQHLRVNRAKAPPRMNFKANVAYLSEPMIPFFAEKIGRLQYIRYHDMAREMLQ